MTIAGHLETLDRDDGSFAHINIINARGHVVGYSGPSAFLHTPETGMVDMNTLIDPLSGWQLHSANSINDFGQTVVMRRHNITVKKDSER